MKKIQILMSTYNGEKFLREQLDSILGQDCEKKGIAEFSLLVRDDGSVDSTQKILQEYQGKYPDRLQWVQGENCGVIGSFFELLRNADIHADFYALSDQDDFWMPDKLSSGILSLEKADANNSRQLSEHYLEKEVPRLYCCRPRLVDVNLSELPSEIKRPPVRAGFGNALIENIVTGCTAVMNKALRDLVVRQLPEFTVMHDRWLYLVASCFGEVIYDETPHICYRQHGGNVVGTNSSRMAEWKERLSGFRRKRHDISRQAAEFVRVYDLMVTESDYESIGRESAEANLHLARDLAAAKHSFFQRIRLVRENKLYRQRRNDNKIFKILILLGAY